MHSRFEILEESTDSAGPDLISLADLKLALGITDSSEDATLQAAITFQSRIIAEYCDRRFGFATAMEIFRLDRHEIMPPRQGLTLKLYPIAQVIELSTMGATDADFDFDPASGRLWNDAGWSDEVAVTYAGGYDLPEEAPARLQRAVIEAVDEVRKLIKRDPSVQSMSHGDVRISYFTSPTSSGSSGYLSARVVDLIRSYRRLYVA